MSGVLTADFEGGHVRFHIDFASEEFSHSFMVEQYHGMKPKLDRDDQPVFNPDGSKVLEEDWRAIHTGTRKFVQGSPHDYHMSYLPDGHPDIPYMRQHGRPRKYRALAYRDISDPDPSRQDAPLVLHTEGVFTNVVEI